MTLPDVELMARLDAEFQVASGLTDRRFYKIFYSAIAPAPLLVLGFNPGGETDGTDLSASDSFYENWEHDYVDFRALGNAYKLAGRAYDTLSQVLQTSSEEAIRRIPATNVIFRRSRRSSDLNLTVRNAAHESGPVLAEILRAVNPAAILLIGSTATEAFVREHCVEGSLAVNAEPQMLFKPNGVSEACMFRSARAHVTALGRDVPLLTVGHISKYYARHGIWLDVIDSLRAELVRLGVSPLGDGGRGLAAAATSDAVAVAVASADVGADAAQAIGRKPHLGCAPPSGTVSRTQATSPTSTSEVRQSEVGALRNVCELLGLALEDPAAAYPGRGKVVRLSGDRRVYVNAGHADVKALAREVAAWEAEGFGNVRPDNALYLRVKLDSNGVPLTPRRQS